MPYNPQIYHRRSIRLKGYDYTSPGAYFVTICTQGRVCALGDIVDGVMQLNDAGRMVQTVWESIPDRFPTVAGDVYVIMPNHFHAIITIHNPVGATLVVAPEIGAGTSPALAVAPDAVAPGGDAADGAGAPTLGDVVGAFKSITTNEYIAGVREMGWPRFDRRLWQRNYWEHIIRTSAAHARIADYIRDNPARWQADQLHPAAPPNRFNQEA